MANTQEKIQQTKRAISRINDPNQNEISFFKTNLSFPKSLSPFRSKNLSPKSKTPLSLSRLTSYDQHEVVKVFREKLKIKRTRILIDPQKRAGFLQDNAYRSKKKESLFENPFQAMIWKRIMSIRPKKEVQSSKFENKLLRMAFDRKEKLINLVFFFLN